jgi:hypothetical protein
MSPEKPFYDNLPQSAIKEWQKCVLPSRTLFLKVDLKRDDGLKLYGYMAGWYNHQLGEDELRIPLVFDEEVTSSYIRSHNVSWMKNLVKENLKIINEPFSKENIDKLLNINSEFSPRVETKCQREYVGLFRNLYVLKRNDINTQDYWRYSSYEGEISDDINRRVISMIGAAKVYEGSFGWEIKPTTIIGLKKEMAILKKS